jgi:hypothetical protein
MSDRLRWANIKVSYKVGWMKTGLG